MVTNTAINRNLASEHNYWMFLGTSKAIIYIYIYIHIFFQNTHKKNIYSKNILFVAISS